MKRLISKHKISGTLKLYYLLIVIVGVNLIVMCTSGNSTLKFGLKMYISTIGNDSWSGRLQQPDKAMTDGPFATIEKARDAIRLLKETKKLPKGNVISRNICAGGDWDKPAGFWKTSNCFNLVMRYSATYPDIGVVLPSMCEPVKLH
jgi:hypothetical protein